MRDRDELIEEIVFLLHNPVSDDAEVQAGAILDEIDDGRVEQRFYGEDANVRANLYIADRYREGMVLLEHITGEDGSGRPIDLVTMAKGTGLRVTEEHLSDD